MLGFHGWAVDFSQSIHKLGLFHGWDAGSDVSIHGNRLFCGWDAGSDVSVHGKRLFCGWDAGSERHPEAGESRTSGPRETTEGHTPGTTKVNERTPHEDKKRGPATFLSSDLRRTAATYSPNW